MPNPSRRVENHDRRLKALEMRKARATYTQIGQKLGISKQRAYTIVQQALRETLQEPADDVRKLELETLDRLQFGLWQHAAAGNQGAVDRVLRIMERRAKLLGLDAPSQLEHGGNVILRVIYDDDEPGTNDTST